MTGTKNSCRFVHRYSNTLADTVPFMAGSSPYSVLKTTPWSCIKKGVGEAGIPVEFAGVVFRSDEWLYADQYGVVVLPDQLR